MVSHYDRAAEPTIWALPDTLWDECRPFLPPEKAPGTPGRDPTNRGKRGTKRQVVSDQRGVPLGVVVSAANCHDMKQAEATLDSIVVARPRPTRRHPQQLCRDKGFDYPATRQAAEACGY